MFKKEKINSRLSRPLAVIAAATLLLFASVTLFAKQKTPAATFPHSPEASTSSSEISLLPLIPSTSDKTPLPPGVTLRSAPSMPGDPPPGPDEFKMLYGYQGLYYNVSNLDGRVAVIQDSIYTWPIFTWKASGLVRNQTRDAMHVSSLTARLIGTDGTVIATATTVLPVADLRPGEPGPFMIESSVARNEVKDVDWQIDSAPAAPLSRPLVIERDNRKISLANGLTYWLIGWLSNDATTTAQDVRVVVAWLDNEKRVRYVAAPAFRPYLDRPETYSTVDLPPGAGKFFTYDPQEPWLVSLFENSHELAIWGISK